MRYSIALLAVATLLVVAPSTARETEARPFRSGDAKDATKRGTSVRQYDFHEVTIQLTSSRIGLDNPYTDATLVVEYQPIGSDDEAQKRTVRGFYYGFGLYKSRFIALEKGRFAYTARLKRTGTDKELTFKGSVSVRDESKASSRGPLSVSTVNPIWFQDREGKAIYLNGAWSHGSLDINVITGTGGAKWRDTSPGNFNRFADQAIANGFIKADGSPTSKYRKEVEKWIDDLLRHRINWIVVTADHMGWGFQTASNWKGLKAGEFNDPYSYDPNAGLIWDHALEYARQNGLYVKMNLQEFCQGNYAHHPLHDVEGVDLRSADEHPDDLVTNPKGTEAWELWVTYLVSRYSAFSNVSFQMGNEPPGNGCKLGSAKWGEFDKLTMDLVKEVAAYPVLYSSGAPVGGGVHQGDYRTFHPTHEKFAASSFYVEGQDDRPFHNEEILAHNGRNTSEWLLGCRYVKFTSFIAGGHGSALVMWNGGGWQTAMAGYKESSVSVYNFIGPLLDDLFTLKPDNSFIDTAPAEWAKGMKSDRHFLVYMQRIDQNRNQRIQPLPSKLILKLPDGDAEVHWFDPVKGRYLRGQRARIQGGGLELTPPDSCKDDFALRITYVE